MGQYRVISFAPTGAFKHASVHMEGASRAAVWQGEVFAGGCDSLCWLVLLVLFWPSSWSLVRSFAERVGGPILLCALALQAAYLRRACT